MGIRSRVIGVMQRFKQRGKNTSDDTSDPNDPNVRTKSPLVAKISQARKRITKR